MRLPTRVIREWKTVTSTDGQEIVWIAVLDNGEFALCVELPERPEPMDPQVWEMLQCSVNGQQHQDEAVGHIEDVMDGLPSPEVGDLTTDEQGRSADEKFRQEREQMRRAGQRGRE